MKSSEHEIQKMGCIIDEMSQYNHPDVVLKFVEEIEDPELMKQAYDALKEEKEGEEEE